jgi:hypothetical protein
MIFHLACPAGFLAFLFAVISWTTHMERLDPEGDPVAASPHGDRGSRVPGASPRIRHEKGDRNGQARD